MCFVIFLQGEKVHQAKTERRKREGGRRMGRREGCKGKEEARNKRKRRVATGRNVEGKYGKPGKRLNAGETKGKEEKRISR